jgi:hypothetical protein
MSWIKKLAKGDPTEQDLYTKYMTTLNEFESHIDYIEGDQLASELGRSHPSAYYVEIRSRRGKEKAYKALAKSDFNWLYRYGKDLSFYILEHKVIPKKHIKKTHKAAELFLKMRRAPNKLGNWWLKNKPTLMFLRETIRWPLKEDNTEAKYKIGPFTVHNTLGLTDEDLTKTNASVEAAIKFVSKTNIPKVKDVLYGEVFIVGKLQESRTMAWYYPKKDVVYLRPLLKFGRGEVHNLIHELGHRYWGKIFPPMKRKEWMRYSSLLARGEVKIGLSPEHEKKIRELRELSVGDVFPVRVGGLIRGGPTIVKKITKTPLGDIRFHLETKRSKKRGSVMLSSITGAFKRQEDSTKRVSKYPTPYSSTSPEEHFCETFALYSMNKLPEEFQGEFQRIVGV